MAIRVRASRPADKALGVLELMQRTGKATVLVYNMVLKVCERAREPRKALTLLEEMRKAGVEPDIISYNTAIGACAKGGLPDEALRLVEQMEEVSLVTYNSVLDALAHVGRWKDAISVLTVIFRSGLKPDLYSYTSLIQVRARA
jgi:pentatricopeptide repeat domain-containing protein 1